MTSGRYTGGAGARAAGCIGCGCAERNNWFILGVAAMDVLGLYTGGPISLGGWMPLVFGKPMVTVEVCAAEFS